MADNIQLGTAVGTGDVLAADDIAGVKFTRSKITVGADGANDGDVSSANPLPVGDAGGSLTIDDGGGSITVDGPLTDAQLRLNPINVGVTSVAGTVSVTQSGVFTVRTQDGGGQGLTSATRGSQQALSVQIVDASGTQITTFGGGTQYTEGDTDASITGTALLWEDTGDTLRAVSAAKPLPVTANLAAGTNNIGDVDVLSVPAPLSTAGGGTEATALRVTIANDSTGVVSVDDNGGSLTVDGTVAATQSGTWTVTGAGGTFPVTDSGGSLTVDNNGTFAVQVDGAALTALQLLDDAVKTDDAAFTPATDKVLMVGAEFDDTAPDSVNEGDAGAIRMSARRELYVQLRDAAGNERGVNVNGSNEVLTAASQTGSWTVTANAGTNLNTSTLALESGGNLAGAATSLAILDDWDESDRCKVNVIAGQAGITAGAGAVAASTPRVTLASNDPAVAALQILDDCISGSEAQVDIVASLPSGTNAIGRVGHDTTALGHGVTTVTTAGTDVALAGSTACKWVIVQSQTDNTGLIAVGASGVDATEATGTGIILYPGDSIFLSIDNLASVFVDSTVNGEGVRYTYGS